MGKKERLYAEIMALHPEVTGSLNLVNVIFPNYERIRFIVDCGLFQEKQYSKYNKEFTFDPNNIDFCLVTHNHVDHIGRLPLLVKKGYNKLIYTSNPTKILMPLALEDSCKVLRELSKRNCERALYNDIDVDNTLRLVKGCDYRNEININDNIKVTFFENGHLVGASILLVQISYPGYEDINLLFTGDYNSNNLFAKVEPLPNWVCELPITVIQESTYGDMESTEIVECFEKNVLACLKKKGAVVSPVFSLGRAQEILYKLKEMQETGKLSKEIPIYPDGNLAIKYTFLYLNADLNIKEEMKNFLPENLHYVDKKSRNSILYDTSVKIILTTSGMGSYGPAQLYIPEYIKRENALIQFTGYTAEGTLGRKLKEAEKGQTVEIGGRLLRKNADVEYTNEFSAHAKSDEMIDFLKQFKRLKLALVNHGEQNVKYVFANKIIEEVEPKDVGILGRDYFFRVNPYGLVETKTTKFM